MTTKISILLGTAMALAIGCSHAPSRELVAARNAYGTAENGPAGALAKAEVYEAKKALDAAEAAHDEKPRSGREVDLAYVALREADYAKAHAEMLLVQKDHDAAKAEYVQTLEKLKNSAENQLGATTGQLEKTNERLIATTADLESEQRAREAIERQLNAAMASIADMAKIEQKDQRTTITLNGSVLFKSDDTQLLPIAQEKLLQVAEVLKQYGDEYTITVNGHTDSRGSDTHNMTLSQGRADSVLNFLTSHGVEKSAVSAIGKGETMPVASNKSAEGRADNRRVEIVIDRKPDAAPAK